MRFIVCSDYAEMCAECTKQISAQIILKPNSVLGLATGSTPIGVYENLVQLYQNNELDFSGVTTFNLDEYYPISADNTQSYHFFMQSHLFSKINIKPQNIHILDGMPADIEKECRDYEKAIVRSGGIDLQLLGIGKNGHIGFNEPGKNLNATTHLTDLTETTIESNARFFKNVNEVPRKALTMGISTILRSKKIILLASGFEKHMAVQSLLTDNINTQTPATMLKVHPDVLLICDKEAYEG